MSEDHALGGELSWVPLHISKPTQTKRIHDF